MKKIISILNQKGGVGKTTISVNLSTALALNGKSTLLIDMDPQANSTIALGIEPEGGTGIHTVLDGRQTIEEVILNTQIDSLHLVPSHLNLGGVEKRLTSQIYREQLLKNTVQNLAYEYILIDLGPDLDNLAINAVYASNLILVPLDLTKFALVGLANVLEFVMTIKGRESAFDITKLLLNKYDLRKKGSNAWFLDQLSQHQEMLLKTIIRLDSTTEHAHSSEEPVLKLKKDSKAGEDFIKLTQEILML